MLESVKKAAEARGWTCSEGADEPASRLGSGPVPIVVLLGWYGAEIKHVLKYAQLYTERGFDTISGVASGAAVFAPTSGPREEMASELLTLLCAPELADARGEMPPVLFHVFSNGGCFIYESVLHVLKTGTGFAGAQDRIRGCVFDSCPCELQLNVAFTAITTGAGFNPLPYFAGTLAVSVLGFFSLLRCGQESRLQEYFRNLASAPSHIVELFVHSKDDPLCPWEFVERLVNERRARGARVTHLCFEKSRHVAHVREHREEYTRALTGLVRAALPSYSSSSFRAAATPGPGPAVP
eukprot:tig00021168_g19125.t1